MYYLRKISELKKSSFSYLFRKYGYIYVLNYKREPRFVARRNFWGRFVLEEVYTQRNVWIGIGETTDYITERYPHGYVAFSSDESYNSKRFV